MAETLELDAEVFGEGLREVTDWARGHAPASPQRIADIGAGPGAGSLTLARTFPAAEILALDRSELMLDRLRAAAREQGVSDRLRTVRADLDDGLPDTGALDIAWAALSLHHVADPGSLLTDLHAALRPGGLLAVVEMDGLPRFLPGDIGFGLPGLEARCHAARAHQGPNAHPEWSPSLERAGFEVVGRRGFLLERHPAPPAAARYAHALLSRFRTGLEGELSAEDLTALDRLLADGHPEALTRRGDLTARTVRTVWAARRP